MQSATPRFVTRVCNADVEITCRLFAITLARLGDHFIVGEGLAPDIPQKADSLFAGIGVMRWLVLVGRLAHPKVERRQLRIQNTSTDMMSVSSAELIKLLLRQPKLSRSFNSAVTVLSSMFMCASCLFKFKRVLHEVH